MESHVRTSCQMETSGFHFRCNISKMVMVWPSNRERCTRFERLIIKKTIHSSVSTRRSKRRVGNYQFPSFWWLRFFHTVKNETCFVFEDILNEIGTTNSVLTNLSLNKLYTLARELGQIRHGMSYLDNLSLNKLYTLASAQKK